MICVCYFSVGCMCFFMFCLCLVECDVLSNFIGGVICMFLCFLCFLHVVLVVICCYIVSQVVLCSADFLSCVYAFV